MNARVKKFGFTHPSWRMHKDCRRKVFAIKIHNRDGIHILSWFRGDLPGDENSKKSGAVIFRNVYQCF
jgi:hypothetical protein